MDEDQNPTDRIQLVIKADCRFWSLSVDSVISVSYERASEAANSLRSTVSETVTYAHSFGYTVQAR
ncbi:hypothetical protein C8039_20205 [Halogeometricum sp. wsp3]|nr:hypothetical protein C8039_20205 [Halogeometricum sp. wsp3]